MMSPFLKEKITSSNSNWCYISVEKALEIWEHSYYIYIPWDYVYVREDDATDMFSNTPVLFNSLTEQDFDYISTINCYSYIDLLSYHRKGRKDWEVKIKYADWLNVLTRGYSNVEYDDYLQVIEYDDEWNIEIVTDFEECESFVDNLVDMIHYLYRKE